MSTLICSFAGLHDNKVLRYCADFEANTLHMDTPVSYTHLPVVSHHLCVFITENGFWDFIDASFS